MRGPSSPEIIRQEFDKLRQVPIPGNVLMLDEHNNIVDQLVNFEKDETRRHVDESGRPYQPTVVERGGIAPGFDLRGLRDIIASKPETDPDQDPPEQQAEPAPKHQPVQTAQQVEERTQKLQERLRKLEQQLTVMKLQGGSAVDEAEAHAEAYTKSVMDALKGEKRADKKLVDEVLKEWERKRRQQSEQQNVKWTKVEPDTTPPKTTKPGDHPKTRVPRFLDALAAAKFRIRETRHMENRARTRRYVFFGLVLAKLTMGEEFTAQMVEKTYEMARDKTRL